MLQLPPAVLSPGGCGRLFCSHNCAAAAWASWLCVLSTHERSALEACIAASPYATPFDARCGLKEWLREALRPLAIAVALRALTAASSLRSDSSSAVLWSRHNCARL